jgi:hypothetical protein
VWKWDPVAKALTEIRVRLGVSDGQFTELISVMSGGEVNVGDKVVGTVTLPLSMRPTNQQSNPLTGGQPSRGGMPNMGGGGGGGGGRGR